MRIGIISGVLGLIVALPVHAQKSDSIKSMLLPDVVVTETYQQRQAKKSALTVDVADQDFLRKHFTGNFMQAMENIPGVQAMDIGSGFSKPMIRGMGFNRIAVLENGIKQEGQQWGADHGLELDAFNIGAVNVLKGPSSLLYGSDATGGVINIITKNKRTNSVSATVGNYGVQKYATSLQAGKLGIGASWNKKGNIYHTSIF
jgi:iron complex outermembrane receptor protein